MAMAEVPSDLLLVLAKFPPLSHLSVEEVVVARSTRRTPVLQDAFVFASVLKCVQSKFKRMRGNSTFSEEKGVPSSFELPGLCTAALRVWIVGWGADAGSWRSGPACGSGRHVSVGTRQGISSASYSPRLESCSPQFLLQLDRVNRERLSCRLSLAHQIPVGRKVQISGLRPAIEGRWHSKYRSFCMHFAWSSGDRLDHPPSNSKVLRARAVSATIETWALMACTRTSNFRDL